MGLFPLSFSPQEATFVCLAFRDSFPLYSQAWSGTHYVDQGILKPA